MSQSASRRPNKDADRVTRQITLTIIEGVALIRAQGEIDLANADDLRALGEEALSARIATIRVDLSDVTFMDSTGLGALISIRNAALATDRALVLERPPAQVQKILNITGLAGVFTIEGIAL